MALTPEEEIRLAELSEKLGMPGPAEKTAPGSNLSAQDQARLEELGEKYGLPTTPAAAPPGDEKNWVDSAQDIARGMGRGALDLAETPYHLEQLADMGVRAHNYGMDTGLPGGTSEKPWTQALLGDENYASLREFLEPERSREDAPVTHALGTAGEWAIGGLPNLLRKGASAVPDLIMGAGAGGGELVESGLGGDSVVGELVGGGAGTLAGLRKPKDLRAENTAKEFIDLKADDAAAMQDEAAARLAEGEAGTLGDLALDSGVLGVERAAATVNPKFGQKLRDSTSARIQQIEDEVLAPLSGGDATRAAETAQDRTYTRSRAIREAAQNRREGVDATTEQQVAATQVPVQQQQQAAQTAAQAAEAAAAQADQAEGLAQAANRRVDTTKRPDQTSTQLSETYNAAEKEFKQTVEQPAWNAFKDQGVIDASGAAAGMLDVDRALTKAERKLFKNKHGAFLGRLKKWEKGGYQVQAGDISKLRSDIRRAWDAAYDSPNGVQAEDLPLKDMLNALDEGMSSNELFATARNATSELYERFRPEKVGKVRRKGEQETLARGLGFGDEAGASTMRLIEQAQVPELVPQVVEHLQALAARQGGVNDVFLRKYGAVLDALPPEAAAQFTEAVATRGAADTASAAAKQVAKEAEQAEKLTQAAARQADTESKALTQAGEQVKREATKTEKRLTGAVDKNIVSQYGKSPQRTLTTLIKDPDRADDLTRLVKYMDDAGEGPAIRQHAADILQQKLTTAVDAPTDVKPKAIGDFEKLRKNLVQSGLVTPAQAEDMAMKLNRSKTLARRREALGQEMLRAGDEFNNLVASGLSAVAVTALTGTQTLLVGGALRRMIKKRLATLKNPAEVEALERLLLNPEQYLEAASGAKNAEHAASLILTKAVGGSQAAEALTDEEE